MGFAVPFRPMSGSGESRDLFTGRLGVGDFCLGCGELSSPEDSSPPASARSSASKSAMMNRQTSVLSVLSVLFCQIVGRSAVWGLAQVELNSQI